MQKVCSLKHVEHDMIQYQVPERFFSLLERN